MVIVVGAVMLPGPTYGDVTVVNGPVGPEAEAMLEESRPDDDAASVGKAMPALIEALMEMSKPRSGVATSTVPGAVPVGGIVV